MSFLADVIQFFGFLFSVCSIAGLIKPAWFKDQKTGEIPTRWQLFGGCFVASLLAFAISSAIAPGASEKKDKVESSKPAEKTLGIKPEAWRLEFNRIVGKVNQDYKIAELDIESGEVNDAFKRMLGDDIGLMGTVSKQDGTIKELIIMIGGGKDTLRSIAVILSATQAINPSIPKEVNSAAIMEIIKEITADIKNGGSAERIVGDFIYTGSANKLTGLIFAVSPKK